MKVEIAASSSRKEALLIGAVRYHGSACKKCGGTLRMTSNGHCHPCATQKNIEWGKKNKSKRAAAASRYRDKHAEKLKERSQTYRDENREKIRADERARYHRDIEKSRETARIKYLKNPNAIKNKSLKYNYGITIEQYNAMRDAQNNSCLICGEADCLLVVDHCHSSGKIRGLLCNPCNAGIGHLKESTAVLRNAILYIETSPTTSSEENTSEADH